MGRTKLGSEKTAAFKIGCTWQEYSQKQESGHKWCSACQMWAPLDFFNKDSGAIDGLNNKCRKCSRAKDRDRLQRKKQENQ